MKHMFVIYLCMLNKGNVLFNDTLSTFYLWLYVCYLSVYMCWREKEGNVLFNDALNTFFGGGYVMLDKLFVCYLCVYIEGRKCVI